MIFFLLRKKKYIYIYIVLYIQPPVSLETIDWWEKRKKKVSN